MVVPIAMTLVLPMGIMGLLCAAMFTAFISTHDTYLHSWGAIFLQDVILPFRTKPFTPKEHIRYLRLSVGGVAVIIFFFSLWFHQSEDIIMFFILAANFFLGWSGAVIIGGLYVITLSLIQSALTVIFQASLYYFAESGNAPTGFNTATLQNSIYQK